MMQYFLLCNSCRVLQVLTNFTVCCVPCSKQTAKLIPPSVSRQFKPQQWLDKVQHHFQTTAQPLAVKGARDKFMGMWH